MDNFSLLAYGLVAAATVIFIYNILSDRLSHIPTVGSSVPILSFFSAFKGRDLVQEGYNKYRDGAFKYAGFTNWMVIVTGHQLIEELRKAPDDVLSFAEATNQTLAIEYTLGSNIHEDGYHIPIVRTQLTRSLTALFPAVRAEIVASFADNIPCGNEWVALPALETMMRVVSRVSNRVFVGLPKCRDPDYLALNIGFTIEVIKSSSILSLFPGFLKPLVGHLLTNVSKSIDKNAKHLEPIIASRQRNIEQFGPEWADKPNDFLSWLMDEAKGEERTPRMLALRLLVLNFAAIHTSSMTFTHTLYYLAANPEYIAPLRDEVDSIVRAEGWSKASIGKMHKVDSFLRESQRLTGLGTLSMTRLALRDFTFSDGTYLPAGTFVSTPAKPTHYDGRYYADPEVFNPWRFAELRGPDGKGTKYQLVTTSTEYMSFGHGRHACPGRFFAANELKAMLAHIVVTYDVRMEQEGVRPPSSSFGTSLVPNRTAKVMFRKRQALASA